MSALALCLHELGHEVIGSDESNNFFTYPSLAKENIKVLEFNYHNVEKYQNYNFIIGYAYQTDHEEVKEIISRNLPYMYYGDFIESFFQGIKIGVSGTHGKTTTSTFLSKLFPTNKTSAIIGDGTGIGKSNYTYFILEACEYKQHFLSYQFDYLIITNIDYDHPDYFYSIDDVYNTFLLATKKSKTIIINNDDKYLKNIKHQNIITFGITEKSNIQGTILEENEDGYLLDISIYNDHYIISFPFTGIHLIYDFLAAIATYYILEKNTDFIKQIPHLYLPKRRFVEEKISSNILIHDYAHHPTEISSTLLSIKQKYPHYHIITIFQPHTYSRSIYLHQEFQNCFDVSDEVYIANTFISAREKKDKIKEKIVQEIFKKYKRYNKNILNTFQNYENTIFAFLGAGDIFNDEKILFMKINEKTIEKKNKM